MKLMALRKKNYREIQKELCFFYQKNSSQWSLLHLLGTPYSSLAIYGYPAVIGIGVHNIPYIAMMLINHHQHQNGRSDSSFAAILQAIQFVLCGLVVRIFHTAVGALPSFIAN